MRTLGRFAPSATGRAHPGTLLAALLCWLDARSRGGDVLLRIEDLDQQRCKTEWVHGLLDDLQWFGLEFDQVSHQHESAEVHADALDQLAERGLLYPCRCSRTELRDAPRTADGSVIYPGSCRERELPNGNWRDCSEAIRLRLPPDLELSVTDASGIELGGSIAARCGDPVVRRRDGVIAYQLAATVDDAAAGVTHVVRGHDLAASTAVQLAVQALLGLPQPHYRHHLLLLEADGEKLAKFHGAVAADALRAAYTPQALTGLLAQVAGLRADASACAPHDLLADFAWAKVSNADQILHWDGAALHWEQA